LFLIRRSLSVGGWFEPRDGKEFLSVRSNQEEEGDKEMAGEAQLHGCGEDTRPDSDVSATESTRDLRTFGVQTTKADMGGINGKLPSWMDRCGLGVQMPDEMHR
jgi:hypothetical protein